MGDVQDNRFWMIKITKFRINKFQLRYFDQPLSDSLIRKEKKLESFFVCTAIILFCQCAGN